MKLTKYEHACFTLENDGNILIVDPGGFTTDFISPENVVGVVITHEHGDHFDQEQLASILDKNPEALIIAHQDITGKIEAFQTKTVQAGDSVEVGPFRLKFFGGHHALIHSSIPIAANLGVLVNDLLYYPGDSFTLPGVPVDTLAIPAGAPWMKNGEAMDFLAAIKPRMAFPTHDAVLSTIGKELVDRQLGMIAEKQGTVYNRLDEAIEI